MRVMLSGIVMDYDIRCREVIEDYIVKTYAKFMREKTEFPAVVLFGSPDQCWIGDGWYRVLAAKKARLADIDADLRPGGRIDAIRYAISKSAALGRGRPARDKRRVAAMAMREFPGLSEREMGRMCDVHRRIAYRIRETSEARAPSGNPVKTDIGNRVNTTVILETEPGRKPAVITIGAAAIGRGKTRRRKYAPPSNAMRFARMALRHLGQIEDGDTELQMAIGAVREWANTQEQKEKEKHEKKNA